jgi:Cu(I)/Ag(I) efflux system membrane fusion protein
MDRVVVALGEGRFRAQPVRLGIESGDRVAIRSGLKAGETIVVSGQFLIDSESNIESALARMNDGAVEDHSEHEAAAENSNDASTVELEMDEDMDHSEDQTDPVEASTEMDPEMDHSQHQMEDES